MSRHRQAYCLVSHKSGYELRRGDKVLVTADHPPFATGDLIRLQVDGNGVRCFKNNVLFASYVPPPPAPLRWYERLWNWITRKPAPRHGMDLSVDSFERESNFSFDDLGKPSDGYAEIKLDAFSESAK